MHLSTVNCTRLADMRWQKTRSKSEREATCLPPTMTDTALPTRRFLLLTWLPVDFLDSKSSISQSAMSGCSEVVWRVRLTASIQLDPDMANIRNKLTFCRWLMHFSQKSIMPFQWLTGGMNDPKAKARRIAQTAGFKGPKMASAHRCCLMTRCQVPVCIMSKLRLKANSPMESKANHSITSLTGTPLARS